MTVEELCNHLSKIDGKANVVVCWEKSDEMDLLDIDDVAMHRGTPGRDSAGKPGFTFENTGHANWAFINVSGG